MKSLRARLMVHLLAGGVVLLGIAGFGLHWQVKRALVAEFDAALRVALQSLAMLVELEPDGKIVIEGGAENLTEFNRPDAEQVFLLASTGGQEIARARSLGGDPLPARAGAGGQPEFFDATFRHGVALRCAGIRFAPRPEEERQVASSPSSEVLLVLGRDRGSVDRSLAALRTALVLTGAATTAALSAIVGLGVGSGLRPVKRLGEAVANVDAASLSTRFQAEALPTELRPIGERLNALLARLEDSFARERRFAATAAHELRTPLAELHTLAEVNLATPATEGERTESWKDVLATTRRMESLALHLLELTRAEDAKRFVRKVRVPVAGAIEDAWKPHAAQARRRGITLNVSIPVETAVLSDPALLAVVLGNLCGNAAEHAVPGSEFRIASARRDASVVLRFSNRVEELTDDDLSHVFERFWRKDEARSDGSHHGLGLSVARDFVTLLGGSLTAGIPNPDELEFVLCLQSSV